MSNEENNNIINSEKSSNNKSFINTSGQGDNAKVPQIIKKEFNWGAFLLSWIWGLFNKTYITLIYLILGFIPFVNLGVSIWFGFKGNEWAWKNKRFENIGKFNKYQEKWVITGLIFWLVFIPIVSFILIFGFIINSVHDIMSNPEQSEKTMANLEKFLDEMSAEIFKTYSIEEDENKFYVEEDLWQNMSFTEKQKLIDYAAQISASKRKKIYKEQNPNGYQYFSKTDELNRTKIYSAENNEKLLAEYKIDENFYEKDNPKFTDYIGASLKAYKFYK